MSFSDTGNPNKQGCQFEGDKGWVHVNRGGIWAEPASLLKVKIKPDEVNLHESANHHADFIKSVRTRSDPVSEVEAGHKASCLGLITDIAARVKRKIKWDPGKEVFVDDLEANRFLSRPMRSPWHL